MRNYPHITRNACEENPVCKRCLTSEWTTLKGARLSHCRFVNRVGWLSVKGVLAVDFLLQQEVGHDYAGDSFLL